jgi:2-phospho-L-lactate guanylyltransferase
VALTVLVPVNRLARAKGRLARLLTADERSALALATLHTVLDGLGSFEAVVLTADPEVAHFVVGRAEVIAESPDAKGLNPQLEFGVSQLLAAGRATDELAILHADLPLFLGGALSFLAESIGEQPCVGISPSRDGGTNAMLLRPPGLFPLCYGIDSAARHASAAREAGVHVAIAPSPAQELDLDHPEDIRELLSTPRGRESRAGRLLLAIGVDDRLDRIA